MYKQMLINFKLMKEKLEIQMLTLKIWFVKTQIKVIKTFLNIEGKWKKFQNDLKYA